MALFTGIQHYLCALFIIFCQIFGRRRTPSARPSLLMFRINRPISRISSSLVLYRVSRSGSFTLAKRQPLWSRVKLLLLTQRARVRSTVGSISLLRFFRALPSTVRQMSGNLGHIRPRLSYDYRTSSKPYIIRLRTATVPDHSCSTWPSLNNKHHLSIVSSNTRFKIDFQILS